MTNQEILAEFERQSKLAKDVWSKINIPYRPPGESVTTVEVDSVPLPPSENDRIWSLVVLAAESSLKKDSG